MDFTVGELRQSINGVPDDYRVRVDIKCKNMHDYIGVEKSFHTVKISMTRQMVVLESEILDLGPK